MRADRTPRLPANDRVVVGDVPGAWAVNWSPTGACIVTETLVRSGDRVRVDFPERYASAEAVVVWSQVFPDGCLAGLEFSWLDRRAVPVK